MTTITIDRAVVEQALERLDTALSCDEDREDGYYEGAIIELREALAEQPAEQEPVAWLHTKIEGVAVPRRPADLDKHPDRWTALYPEPKPCPTCEALARTVMMDQTGHDTQPAEQEPVAWMVYTLDGKSVCVTDNPTDFTDEHRALPLYTAPQPAKQPLTDEEICDLADAVPVDEISCHSDTWHIRFGRAIERAHGIGVEP